MLKYLGNNLGLTDILDIHREGLQVAYRGLLKDKADVVALAETNLFDSSTFMSELPGQIVFGSPWYVDPRDAIGPYKEKRKVRLHTAPRFSIDTDRKGLEILWDYLERYNDFVQFVLQPFPSNLASDLINPLACNPESPFFYGLQELQNTRYRMMLHNEEISRHLRAEVWNSAELGKLFKERMPRKIIPKNMPVEDALDSMVNWYKYISKGYGQTPPLEGMLEQYTIEKHSYSQLMEINRMTMNLANRLKSSGSN